MRWSFSLVSLLLFALAGPAMAGGVGNLRLAQPLERIAPGEAVLYVQALQHDIHPRPDITLLVVGAGPNGATFVGTGELDCTYGQHYVFAVPLPLEQSGEWRLELKATHDWIFFPPLPLEVEVLPLGSSAPAPAPVKPYASLSHSHGSDYEPACTGAGSSASAHDVTVAAQGGAQGAEILSDAEASTSVPVILLGAVGLVTALAGLLLWRRRGKTQN